MVQPALAAFSDVCDKISAECPGLTAESLCGPVHLPRWLSTDHCATAPSAGTCVAGACGIGSAGNTRRANAGAAAAVSSTLLGDTVPRGEVAAKGSDESEELKRPPPHPATPQLSSMIPSGCTLTPPTVVSAKEPGTVEAVGQDGRSGAGGGEKGQEQGQKVAKPNVALKENMGEISDSVDTPRPGESAQQGVKVPVERHAMDGSDEASLEAVNEVWQKAFRHGRQVSTGSSAGEKEAQPNHSLPLCSDAEAIRLSICNNKAPVESDLVDVEGGASQVNRSTTGADKEYFTYSDGEDGDFAVTPGGKHVTDDSVLLSPHQKANSASPPAPPPDPTSLVVDVVASPPGDLAQGSGGCSCRGSGDDGDASPQQLNQPLHALVGESTHFSSKENDEESGDDGTARVVDNKTENTEPLVVGDEGERRAAVVDSRSEGDTTRNHARAVSRQDAAKAAAPEVGKARYGREEEDRNLVGRGRGRSSAGVLAHAYAGYSSPTRDTSNLLGRVQIRGDNLGRSFTGSVSSSFDASPLKGESISTSVLAAARDSGGAGSSDGVGAGGVDLLAAAKAAVRGERNCDYAAAVGEDLSRPFSAWLDEDRRPTHSKAASGFSSDVDRQASENCGAHNSSRRRETGLEIGAARGVNARRCSEEEGRDGKRAASIADWSSLELEEELFRIREAIESRVRVSTCGRPLRHRRVFRDGSEKEVLL